MREKLAFEVRARVSKRWKDEIDRIAERYSLTPQDVIRQAINLYLRRDPLNNQALPLDLPELPPDPADNLEPQAPEQPAPSTQQPPTPPQPAVSGIP